MPEQVGRDFRTYLASWEHLAVLARRGIIELVELREGETVTLGTTVLRPFRLHESYVYGFLLGKAAVRVLIVLDELHGWVPPDDLRGVDVAVLPMGLHEVDVFTGAGRIAAEHPVLESEATFAQTLEVVQRLSAGRTILTHIEEPDQISYGDTRRLEERLAADGLRVPFAYDTLLIDV